MNPLRHLALPLLLLLAPGCNLRFQDSWPEGERRLTGRTQDVDGEPRAIGHWTFWYQDGVTKQAQGFFDGGRYPDLEPTEFGGTRIPVEGRSKRWSFWNREGRLLCDGVYKRGLRDDLWICYREDGQPCCTGSFVEGRPDGFHVTWHDGRRRDEHDYLDGELAGTRVVRDEEGRPVWSGEYEQGRLVSSEPADVEPPPLHLLAVCAEAAEQARYSSPEEHLAARSEPVPPPGQ
jgi:hypothetical protein